MTPGKVVLITGANAGIGLATSKILAAKGYDIVILCRDKSKGEQTVAELLKVNPGIRAENYTADLSDLAAIQKVAHDITTKYPVIDRLINNAGYYPGVIEYKGEIEKTLFSAHLGHMLLTSLLMPSLKNSTEARVINVSSALHNQGKIDRFFKRVKGQSLVEAYADSKLANILFTMGLAKQLPENVVTYSLHPGVVKTNFGKGTSGFFSMMFTIFRPFFISPEQGAATSVYLADTEIQKIKPFAGGYFANQKPKKVTHKDVTDQNAIWLWNKSSDYIKPYLS